MIEIADRANTVSDLITAHEKKPGPAAESHSGLYTDKHRPVKLKSENQLTAWETKLN